MNSISRSVKTPARRLRVGRVAFLVAVISFAVFGVVSAEDEDTSSSVYLVFDPETGEFVTEDDQDAALPNQTGLEDSGLHNSNGHGSNDQTAESGNMTVMIGIAALVVLFGAGYLIMRRRAD